MNALLRQRLVLLVLLLAAAVLGIAFGETALSAEGYAAAFRPGSPEADVLFAIRAPRVLAAAMVGAALGASGAVMQGLLRNPLADPGVLGVSACAGLGAALSLSAGLAALPGLVEASALLGAALGGAVLTFAAARLPGPEGLILFGVSLSAFAGALTALVFNLAPSPVTLAETLNWMLGSVAARDWPDLGAAAVPMLAGGVLAGLSARGLLVLTLGEETAAVSGLPMARLRAMAVAGAALMTGAAVALAGVIGFVGLAAPHLVRRGAGENPVSVLLSSALAGAVLVVAADLIGRMIPGEALLELKLGVLTALFGAPLFALIAWRASRSWRA